MLKIKVGKKELKVKFGYKPTLKERVLSKVAKYSRIKGDGDDVDLEKVEDLLLYLPELLLVGLQVHHPEYRYDYDTKEGKEEKLNEIFDIIDEYSCEDDADLVKLFNDIQGEMLKDSFLARLFQQEQKKLDKAEAEKEETEN